MAIPKLDLSKKDECTTNWSKQDEPFPDMIKVEEMLFKIVEKLEAIDES